MISFGLGGFSPGPRGVQRFVDDELLGLTRIVSVHEHELPPAEVLDAARGPRYLRTVHGLGYAFCGVVTDDAPRRKSTAWRGLHFRLTSEGGDVSLAEGENVVGRVEDAVAWSSRRASREDTPAS